MGIQRRGRDVLAIDQNIEVHRLVPLLYARPSWGCHRDILPASDSKNSSSGGQGRPWRHWALQIAQGFPVTYNSILPNHDSEVNHSNQCRRSLNNIPTKLALRHTQRIELGWPAAFPQQWVYLAEGWNSQCDETGKGSKDNADSDHGERFCRWTTCSGSWLALTTSHREWKH